MDPSQTTLFHLEIALVASRPQLSCRCFSQILSSRAITMLLSIIRAKDCSQRQVPFLILPPHKTLNANSVLLQYVEAADRLMVILAEEGLARLECVQPTTIETPCGSWSGLSPPPTHQICGVDIVRSGGILLEAVRKVAPDSKTAKILIQRDEATAEPKLFYSKLPPRDRLASCDPLRSNAGDRGIGCDGDQCAEGGRCS